MSSGRSVILRAGGQVVAFLTEKKTKITAAPKEITNGDSDGFRTYSPAPAKLTAQIQLKGNAKTEWMRNAGLSPGVQVTLFNIELIFTGGSKITGSFYVAEFTEGGESGTARELTLTLESTGQWELTTGEQSVAITFGQYPWLAGVDTFTVSAAINSIELKEKPYTDTDTLTISAGINSIQLEVAAVYNSAFTDTDTLTIGAGITSIQLEVAAVYNNAFTDTDTLTIGAGITSIQLEVAANYVNHTIYDADQLSISAAINSIELIEI